MLPSSHCDSHNQQLRSYIPSWSRDTKISKIKPTLRFNGNSHQLSKKIRFSSTIKKGTMGFVSRPICSEQNNVFPDVDPSLQDSVPPTTGTPVTVSPQLFNYSFNNTSTSYDLSDDDKKNYVNAVNRWSEIVTSNPMNASINVTFEIADLQPNILGQAQVSDFYTVPGTSGNKLKELFPRAGVITLNQSHFEAMKSNIRADGTNDLYNVVLHELGHILGIGILFSLSDANFGYTGGNDDGTEYMYIGENALREYTTCFPPYFSYVTYVGIPIEEDGGSGTAIFHPEEGNLASGVLSSNNRTYLGVHYPGMQNEIMTGWSDSGNSNLPLSRISIGFLEDIGYSVDYSKADAFPT